MNISPADIEKFPRLPELRARWTPIYLEPIPGSGERITVAIAILTDKERIVRSVIREDALRCFLGNAADKFQGLVDACVQSLSKYMAQGGELSTWLPPFEGVFPGNEGLVYATDMTAALRMAIRESAFLAALPQREGAEDTSDSAQKDESGTDRWRSQVKSRLEQLAPNLVVHFGREIELPRTRRRRRIDYLGNRMVAQLGRIIPGRGIGHYIRSAKVSLWELEDVRILRHDMKLFEIPEENFELILYRPSDDDPAYDDKDIEKLHDAINELEEEGDRHNLRVRPVTNAQEAAQRIVEAEAA